MNKHKFELYHYISRVREGLAGSNIQSVIILKQYIKEAIRYAMFVGVNKDMLNKLIQVQGMILNIKDYGDRLEPDQILCDILNELLEEEDDEV